MSSIPLPDPTQVDPVQPAPQPGGRVRSLLSNFFQGAGSAMMQHVGLPTPQEQAQQAFNNDLALRRQKSVEDYHDILGENAGLKIELQQNKQRGPLITREMAVQNQKLAPYVDQYMGEALTKIAVAGIGADTSAANAQLGATSREKVAAENAQNKTPNEIGLIKRWQAGDQEAGAILKQLQANRVALASAKGQAFGSFRPGAYIDPEGNLIADYSGHAIAEGYTPAAPGAKAMSAQAQFGEIRTGSAALRNAITNLDRDFTPNQRAKLSLAMRAPDESVLHTIVNSMLGTEQLTPAQQDYVISATQMHERVLGLRQMAGMGQGSESTRIALQATVPNVNMADKAYGLKQLDAVDQQVESLYQGVPKVRSFGRGGGNTGGFVVPKGAPSASGVPDGHILRQHGKPVAKAMGGKWVQP